MISSSDQIIVTVNIDKGDIVFSFDAADAAEADWLCFRYICEGKRATMTINQGATV